jgi:hypothetical protein
MVPRRAVARGDRDRVQHSGTPYPKRTISPTAVEASRKPADPVAMAARQQKQPNEARPADDDQGIRTPHFLCLPPA